MGTDSDKGASDKEEAVEADDKVASRGGRLMRTFNESESSGKADTCVGAGGGAGATARSRARRRVGRASLLTANSVSDSVSDPPAGADTTAGAGGERSVSGDWECGTSDDRASDSG
jgi:hypothetical protein